jgi:hypothetical protein
VVKDAADRRARSAAHAVDAIAEEMRTRPFGGRRIEVPRLVERMLGAGPRRELAIVGRAERSAPTTTPVTA